MYAPVVRYNGTRRSLGQYSPYPQYPPPGPDTNWITDIGDSAARVIAAIKGTQPTYNDARYVQPGPGTFPEPSLSILPLALVGLGVYLVTRPRRRGRS